MKLQDYIHYYLKSAISFYIFPDETISNGWLDRLKIEHPTCEYAPKLTFSNYDRFLKDGYKPILRKLEDITDEEQNEIDKLKSERTIVVGWKGVEITYDNPTTFDWMLKKHFDVFGLIDAGLAIDSKTLK